VLAFPRPKNSTAAHFLDAFAADNLAGTLEVADGALREQ
jgi:hypothetical protein